MRKKEKDFGPRQRVAVIHACWHRDIVDRGRDAFIEELVRLGHARDLIDVFEVPGSLELPLQAKLIAKGGRYSAIAAIGFVVDGGIYRHDFVAASVIEAIMQVQLETEVPILSAVLTPHNFHETEEHKRFFQEHFVVKGKELASACAATVRSVAAARAQRIRTVRSSAG